MWIQVGKECSSKGNGICREEGVWQFIGTGKSQSKREWHEIRCRARLRPDCGGGWRPRWGLISSYKVWWWWASLRIPATGYAFAKKITLIAQLYCILLFAFKALIYQMQIFKMYHCFQGKKLPRSLQLLGRQKFAGEPERRQNVIVVF